MQHGKSKGLFYKRTYPRSDGAYVPGSGKRAFRENSSQDAFRRDGEPELPVEGGKQISVNYVGKNFQNYDSILVLSHFKGHPMGGFGGALKNISIGIASSHGKAHIHGAGHPEAMWTADHDSKKPAPAGLTALQSWFLSIGIILY